MWKTTVMCMQLSTIPIHRGVGRTALGWTLLLQGSHGFCVHTPLIIHVNLWGRVAASSKSRICYIEGSGRQG